VRILLDHNLPRRLRRLLPGHYIRTAQEMSWEEFTNGRLLTAGEEAGFDVLITGDKNLSYQQNLTGRRIALIVLGANSWKILRDHQDVIQAAVDSCSVGSFQRVPLKRDPIP
jgi:hypothetical protein